MTIVSVENINKKYGNNKVLENISFSLSTGHCIALIGPNGAGKTTMLRILTGLIKASSGHYHVHHDAKDIRSIIGYLPQHPVFHHWMTGEEFLIYSAKLTGISHRKARERTNLLLKRVGITHAKNKEIHRYSGGMKQRLGIAQALIHHPRLLVLDEPVSALDPLGRREVLDLIHELKAEMTVLFSTHILSDADEVSDDIILLHQGKVIEANSIHNLRKKYETAKIELSFDTLLSEYEETLKQLETVLHIKNVQDTLHVTVTDINEARLEILTIAKQYKWPILKFIINRTSLEDMFIKAVSS